MRSFLRENWFYILLPFLALLIMFASGVKEWHVFVARVTATDPVAGWIGIALGIALVWVGAGTAMWLVPTILEIVLDWIFPDTNNDDGMM